MLTLYLGGVELSQAIGVDRKVTLTSRTVADLVSQSTSVNNAEMTNILNAAAAVAAPFADLQSQGHGVEHQRSNSAGTAKIAWSDTL